MSNGRPFNYDAVTEKIVLGRLPRNTSDLDVLMEKSGVGAVVTLNEGWELFLSQAQVEAKVCIDPLPCVLVFGLTGAVACWMASGACGESQCAVARRVIHATQNTVAPAA